jgi:hypothetical protein
MVVIRRLLNVPIEVTAAEDVTAGVRDLAQARIVAAELGLPALPSTANSGQKKDFVLDVKSVQGSSIRIHHVSIISSPVKVAWGA